MVLFFTNFKNRHIAVDQVFLELQFQKIIKFHHAWAVKFSFFLNHIGTLTMVNPPLTLVEDEEVNAGWS